MNKNVVKASIFMRENDAIDGVALYSSIISRAIGCGLSNYIVLRGSAGFGRSGITHRAVQRSVLECGPAA